MPSMMLIELATPATTNTASSTAPTGYEAIQSSPGMSVRAMTAPRTQAVSAADTAVAARRWRGVTVLVRSSISPAAKAGTEQANSPSTKAPVLLFARGEEGERGAEAEEDADAADARHDARMHLLRPAEVVIAARTPVQSRRADHVQRGDRGDPEGKKDDRQHARKCTFGRSGTKRLATYNCRLLQLRASLDCHTGESGIQSTAAPSWMPACAGMTNLMILVTGGAGFIGGNFVHHWLAAHDERVVVLDKLTYAGNPATIAAPLQGGRAILAQHDIGDRDAVRALLQSTGRAPCCTSPPRATSTARSTARASSSRPTWSARFCLLEEVRDYWSALAAKRARRLPLPARLDRRGLWLARAGRPGVQRDARAYEPNSPYSASKAGSDHLVRA